MSRIGKRPVEIPTSVKVKVTGQEVEIAGPKGVLQRIFHPRLNIEMSDGKILVKRRAEDKLSRSLHGLTRALLTNMIKGVTEGYEKKLAIEGVGYKVQVAQGKLTMQLGFSHPAVYQAPAGVEIKLDKQNNIIVSGCSKELVGEVAAEIRHIKPPEPYRGKGIRYVGEYVRRKVGKKTV